MEFIAFEASNKTTLFGVSKERIKDLINESMDAAKKQWPEGFTIEQIGGIVITKAVSTNEIFAAATMLEHKSKVENTISKLREDAVKALEELPEDLNKLSKSVLSMLNTVLDKRSAKCPEDEKSTSDAAPVDGKGE